MSCQYKLSSVKLQHGKIISPGTVLAHHVMLEIPMNWHHAQHILCGKTNSQPQTIT